MDWNSFLHSEMVSPSARRHAETVGPTSHHAQRALLEPWMARVVGLVAEHADLVAMALMPDRSNTNG